jgi:integrase
MDTKYLLLKGNTYYAILRVTPSLQPIVGKQRFQQSLKTSDIREARKRRHAVIAKWRDYLDTITKAHKAKTPIDKLTAAAKLLGESLRSQEYTEENIRMAWEDLLEQYLRENHKRNDKPDWNPEEDEEWLIPSAVEKQIDTAYKVVFESDFYLISKALEDYLKEIKRKVRNQTYTAKERRIQAFLSWLKVDREPKSITKREAGRYVTEELLMQSAAIKTTKDTIGDLSAFFSWMEARGMIDSNPFKGLSGSVKEHTRGTPDKIKRREWTEEELKKLLTGIPKGDKRYICAVIALYSGMRANEIAELEVKDVNDDYFHIPEGKTESSVRNVPIHPVIKALVKECKEKSYDGYLIPGLKRGGEDNKRGHYLIKRLSRLIRVNLGITDPKVVFHSLRKNFSTALENAQVPEHIAQQIVGHKKQSLTYGLYSKGVNLKVLHEAVAKVTYGETIDGLIG